MNEETKTNSFTVHEATLEDLKLSLIVTSLMMNAFVLVAWLVVSYGTGYQLILGS